MELYHELKAIGGFNTDTLLSCDIETTGFNPVEDEVIAVGFSNPDGDVVVISIDMLQNELAWELIAANWNMAGLHCIMVNST